MTNTIFKIPLAKPNEDLTIIYKDGNDKIHEIKTISNELINCLRHFKTQVKEIEVKKMIYIQEDIDSDTFEDFIKAIQSKEININEKNFQNLYYLSSKYEYFEMKKLIEQFIEERPDVISIIQEISADNDDLNSSKIKTDLIAKNLDICIKSGFLNNDNIRIIINILNSPERVIKDHHLLFNFVLNLIRKYKENKSKSEQNEFYLVLPGVLDYCKMNDKEIIELFDVINDDIFLSPQNANEKIKDCLLHPNSLIKDEILSTIKTIEEKYQQKIQDLKEKDEIKNKKIEELTNMIEYIKNENQKMQKQILDLQERINEHKDDDDDVCKNVSHNQEKNIINITYDNNSNNIFNGIISYLGNGNPKSVLENKVVEIKASSVYSSHPNLQPQNIFDYQNSKRYFASKNEKKSWVCIDFKDYSVRLSYYVLQTSGIENRFNPKKWEISGSNDKNLWIQLDSRYELDFDSLGIARIFEIQSDDIQYYRYIRILQTGENKNSFSDGNLNILCFSSIEFFGSIKKQEK